MYFDIPPSLRLRRPHTAPCLSSCYLPGPRSHRPRSPRRIWERHAGSRPGCWALTSQSPAAAFSIPPRHRTPTHRQSGPPMGGREAWGEGRVHSAWAGQQSWWVKVCKAEEQNETEEGRSSCYLRNDGAGQSSAMTPLFKFLILHPANSHLM